MACASQAETAWQQLQTAERLIGKVGMITGLPVTSPAVMSVFVASRDVNYFVAQTVRVADENWMS